MTTKKSKLLIDTTNLQHLKPRREKHVFNNSELAHVWAQGNLAHGHNPGSTFYFDGYKIYSYGSQYLAAQLYNTKKFGKFALVNSHNYSSSTCKHLRDIRSALRGKMKYFHTSKPDNISQAIKDNDESVKNQIKYALSKKKITDKYEINYYTDRILELQKDANNLRELVGRKKLKTPHDDIKKVREHLNARLKMYEELNTPEELAKKAIKREKLVLARQKKNEEKLAQAISDFRAHKNTQVFGETLQYDILRIRTRIDTGEREIQTSRGAIVPYEQALEVYKTVVHELETKGPDFFNGISGFSLGNYLLESVLKLDNGDYVVKAGCHKILLSECTKLFAGERDSGV